MPTSAASTVPAAPDSRGQRLVPYVALVIGGVCLFAAQQTAFWSDRLRVASRVDPVGILTPERGMVRHRPADEIAWHDLSSAPIAVGEGEMIFTGDDGEAVLDIAPGRVIRIEPRTLLSVRFSTGIPGAGSDEREVSVMKGSVKLEVAPGSAALALRVGAKRFRIGAEGSEGRAEYRVEPGSDGATGWLAVDSSSPATLDSQAAPAPMLRLDASGLAPPVAVAPIKPLSPRAEEKTVRDPVHFEWQVLRELKADESLHLEIEGSVVRDLPLAPGAESLSHSLPPGGYRWRIALIKKGSTARVRGPATAFSVVGALSLSLTGPMDGARIYTPDGGSGTVVLSWDELPEGARAEVQIESDDPTVPSLGEVGGPRGIAFDLPLGRYRWRARGIGADEGGTAWTAWRRFILSQAKAAAELAGATGLVALPLRALGPGGLTAARPLPVAPSLLAARETLPADDGTLGAADPHLVLLTLEWKAVPEAVRYRVELQADGGAFGRAEETRVNRASVGVPAATDLGKLKYRVTAVLRSGAQVTGDPQPVLVELVAPQLRKPAEAAEMLVGRRVLLAWDLTRLAQQYRIQVSRDAGFEKVVVDQTVRTGWWNHVPAEAGTYFWRVRALRQGHDSGWSVVRRFSAR